MRVDANTPPLMGGEDFSFMLEARPGAFIFIGNGDSAGLHHPAYDFNDDVIPVGVVVLGAARRDRDAGLRLTAAPAAGRRTRPAGRPGPRPLSAAQSRAAMLALGSGPAISRSSICARLLAFANRDDRAQAIEQRGLARLERGPGGAQALDRGIAADIDPELGPGGDGIRRRVGARSPDARRRRG